jgi:OTU domain-containing protein 6
MATACTGTATNMLDSVRSFAQMVSNIVPCYALEHRAVADQLVLHGASDAPHDFNALRAVAASYMRSHPEEFCPFLGLELGDSEFDAYCDKVASPTAAEWGGQLELKALCAALQQPILVYSADAPVLRMSEQSVPADAAPLRVTFHRHYYSLGEHYNSVTPV